MMFWALQGRPLESGLGLLTVLVGGILFTVSKRKA
jgi:hypothetical protein